MDKVRKLIFALRMSPFSPLCISIMDFFLENPTLYFTSMTACKSMNGKTSPDMIKNCMNLLLKNSYLTKEDGIMTHHYNITKENMEFWVTDFKRYVLHEEEKTELIKKEPDNLPVDTSEDNE